MAKPNPMGSSFAERAAAARGDEDWAPPEDESAEPAPNTTFAERAGAEAKVVTAEDEKSEGKAPKKRAAKKS